MTSEIVLEDELYQKTALYTVGFLVQSKDSKGRQAFVPCGSGVLADIGGVKGVVTAAHVILEVQKYGRAALFTIVNSTKKSRPLDFDPQELTVGMVGPSSEASAGPDIGFVQLPIKVQEHLTAENVFYNFAARFAAAETEAPAVVAHLLAGVLAEKSELKDIGASRIDNHTMVLGGGTVHNERKIEQGLDLFDFHCSHNDDVSRPGTYGGLSGSAIWKTATDGDNPERVVLGIVFYETEKGDAGERAIICNGPETLYTTLINLVASRFERQFKEFRQSSG